MSSEEFLHIRIIAGVVVSFCMARLLERIAIFIQHPTRKGPEPLQLIWLLVLLLSVVEWWWLIFDLKYEVRFDYSIYMILLFYAFIYYFIVFLLTPDNIDEYGSFFDYFLQVRRIFFLFSILVHSQFLVLGEVFGMPDAAARPVLYGAFAVISSLYLLAMVSRRLSVQLIVSVSILGLSMFTTVMDFLA